MLTKTHPVYSTVPLIPAGLRQMGRQRQRKQRLRGTRRWTRKERKRYIVDKEPPNEKRMHR